MADLPPSPQASTGSKYRVMQAQDADDAPGRFQKVVPTHAARPGIRVPLPASLLMCTHSFWYQITFIHSYGPIRRPWLALFFHCTTTHAWICSPRRHLVDRSIHKYSVSLNHNTYHVRMLAHNVHVRQIHPAPHARLPCCRNAWRLRSTTCLVGSALNTTIIPTQITWSSRSQAQETPC